MIYEHVNGWEKIEGGKVEKWGKKGRKEKKDMLVSPGRIELPALGFPEGEGLQVILCSYETHVITTTPWRHALTCVWQK